MNYFINTDHEDSFETSLWIELGLEYINRDFDRKNLMQFMQITITIKYILWP